MTNLRCKLFGHKWSKNKLVEEDIYLKHCRRCPVSYSTLIISPNNRAIISKKIRGKSFDVVYIDEVLRK